MRGPVSAYMGGTRGSGVLSSACDVLEMSVVRGVGGVCDMCMYLARVGCGGGERIGFGLYQSWRNLGKVGYVVLVAVVLGGQWVGGFLQGLEGWGYVCVSCESGFFVLMAGPGICILC